MNRLVTVLLLIFRMGMGIGLANSVAASAQKDAETAAAARPGAVARHSRTAKQFVGKVFGPSPHSTTAPIYEAALGLNFVRANAGPSECGCFHMYGENAQFAVVPRGGIAVVADVGRTTANNIAGQGHDISLTTYLAGIRYPLTSNQHMYSYAEVLIGAGHSDTNFAIDSSATNFAYALGGGITAPLGRGFNLKLVEVDFLGTLIPNGVNDRQNQLRLVSGVGYRFQRLKVAR